MPDIVGADTSIDSLMAHGIETIKGIMNACRVESTKGRPSRECVQNLRDCMSMLHDLKEAEQALLDAASDAELESIVNK